LTLNLIEGFETTSIAFILIYICKIYARFK
jgi:hypothetical protein